MFHDQAWIFLFVWLFTFSYVLSDCVATNPASAQYNVR
uniref:Uncharacterized protein n=1 Tax=Arundo donax TaxID=35708 RepID=A0A0A9CE56_ARUDO